jgi:hypothetical protein
LTLKKEKKNIIVDENKDIVIASSYSLINFENLTTYFLKLSFLKEFLFVSINIRVNNQKFLLFFYHSYLVVGLFVKISPYLKEKKNFLV